MFKRNHHLRIAAILQSLDSEFLKAQQCYFGGGTAIVLKNDEYRESIDIDFLVSNLESYKKLRQALTSCKGLNAILKIPNSINITREIRADQYGIRTLLDAGNGVEVKFEIVLEARINLELPSKEDSICGITTLSKLDMATTKILANSDRWYDDSVFSRDLIDLLMLDLSPEQLHLALKKASVAYGDSAIKDLEKAATSIQNRSGRLGECMDALKMDMPEALLWQKISNFIKRI